MFFSLYYGQNLFSAVQNAAVSKVLSLKVIFQLNLVTTAL